MNDSDTQPISSLTVDLEEFINLWSARRMLCSRMKELRRSIKGAMIANHIETLKHKNLTACFKPSRPKTTIRVKDAKELIELEDSIPVKLEKMESLTNTDRNIFCVKCK